MQSIQNEYDVLCRIAQNLKIELTELSSLPSHDALNQLRSNINGHVFSTTYNWMDPLWVLRHKSRNKSLIFEKLSNQANMNWITIGGVGTRYFGISDTSGMTTPYFEIGSIDIWIRGRDSIEFPSLMVREGKRVELHNQEDQVFEWSSIVGAISFERRFYHVEEGGHESIYNEISIQNRSLEKQEFSFYVALRPFSIRGVEPIIKVEYNQNTHQVYLNDLLALVLDQSPSAIIIGSANDKSLFSKLDGISPNESVLYDDPRGLATIILRYDVTLDSASSEQFFFASPLEKIKQSSDIPQYALTPDQRHKAIANWFTYSDATSEISFPEKQLNKVLIQARSNLSSSVRHFVNSDSSIYWSEKARLLEGLCLANDTSLPEKIALELVNKCSDSWSDTTSSCSNPFIWSILQCYTYSQNLSYLRQIRLFINHVLVQFQADLKKHTLLFRGNEKPSNGELHPIQDTESDAKDLPQNTPDEVEVSDLDSTASEDHTINSAPLGLDFLSESLWYIRNLKLTWSCFDALGDVDRAATSRQLLIEYLENFLEFYSDFIETNLPTLLDHLSPSYENTLLLFELLLSSCELGHNNDYSEIFYEYIVNNLYNDSLVCLPGSPRIYSSHLAMRLVQYLSICGEPTEIASILDKMLEFVSPFSVFPDIVNTATKGGMGENGCSVFASADVIIALRFMMVQEQDNNLVVFRAIPDNWFTADMPLVAKDLPTCFGPVSVEIGSSANQYQVEIRLSRLPEELVVHLPAHIPISMIKVFGAGVIDRTKNDYESYVRVVPLSDEVVLTYHK